MKYYVHEIMQKNNIFKAVKLKLSIITEIIIILLMYPIYNKLCNNSVYVCFIMSNIYILCCDCSMQSNKLFFFKNLEKLKELKRKYLISYGNIRSAYLSISIHCIYGLDGWSKVSHRFSPLLTLPRNVHHI